MRISDLHLQITKCDNPSVGGHLLFVGNWHEKLTNDEVQQYSKYSMNLMNNNQLQQSFV